MQKLIFTGNLCDKPESRGTSDGRQVCNFTVAVNRPQRAGQERREADFFRVAVWDNKAIACMTYLDKGSKVCVAGTVSARAYIDRNGDARAVMDVSAIEVEFLGKPAGSADAREAAYMAQEREAIQQENRPEVGFAKNENKNRPTVGSVDQQSGFETVPADDLPF